LTGVSDAATSPTGNNVALAVLAVDVVLPADILASWFNGVLLTAL